MTPEQQKRVIAARKIFEEETKDPTEIAVRMLEMGLPPLRKNASGAYRPGTIKRMLCGVAPYDGVIEGVNKYRYSEIPWENTTKAKRDNSTSGTLFNDCEDIGLTHARCTGERILDVAESDVSRSDKLAVIRLIMKGVI